MSGSATVVSYDATVAGTRIPVSKVTVVSGTYGSVGHATIVTGVTALQAAGIDLVEVTTATIQVAVFVYVQYGSGATTTLFGGELVSTNWKFEADEIELHCRDWGGVLVDQRRVLTRDATLITETLAPLSPGQDANTTGVSTMNRNVSQVVTDIAQSFGFTPQIQMAAGSDVPAGVVYGSQDHVFMTIPQNLWSVLCTLARDTGNEMYVTPDKKLVFGQPAFGLTNLSLTWRKIPIAGSSDIPVRDLMIDHNPRRNSTFRVLVISYDPAKASVTLGRATYVGDNLGTSSVQTGLHVGSAAVAADSAIAQTAATRGLGRQSTLAQVQLYTFHWDGLSADAAAARAGAIATDIAKRLLLMQCRIDGYPALVPTQPATLSVASEQRSPQYVPAAYTANTWYVMGFTHTILIPQSRNDPMSGFWTDLHLLDVPSAAVASAAGVSV